MPYINEDSKWKAVNSSYDLEDLTFEEVVDAVGQHINRLPDDDKEGAANYAISTIVAKGLKPDTGWRYMWLNRAYCTFGSAAAEFYRRLVAPYEDKCIEKNGDIPEYEND